MEVIAYLLKVNIAIIVLYGFYRLFFQQDTFFQCKRVLLLSIFFIALVYPLGGISQRLIRNEKVNQAIANQVIVSGMNIPSFYLNEVVIEAKGPETVNTVTWQNWIPFVLSGIYGLGVFALSCWMILQMVGIFIKIFKSQPVRIHGRTFHLVSGITAPFSFFRWIVLDSNCHSEKELNEIILHEETHVKQWHSIDMLICELMCIFCWFNPFIWLMKREIRINLEYLADRAVLHSGCDTEHYQFHLLRLSYHKAAAKLTNNFNVSPLKKRIQMMNKNQTSWIGLTKYALFVPLVAALLLFNNLQAISNEITSLKMKSVFGAFDPESVENTNPAAKGDSSVFQHVQVPPAFPGGEKALMEYMKKNVNYPNTAALSGVSGQVILRFVVTNTGKLEDVIVQRSLDPACDAEAVRVVKSMPNWTPGKQDGKPASVYYTLPISFKLDNSKNETAPIASVERIDAPMQNNDFVIIEDSMKVYLHVDIPPQYPGGEAELMNFLREKINYPVEAINNKIEGHVILRFVVTSSGKITDVEVQRSLGPACDKEAVRVVRSMPIWAPGKQDDKPVSVYYSLPILFKLNNSTNAKPQTSESSTADNVKDKVM